MTRMCATGPFDPRNEAGFFARMQAGLLPVALDATGVLALSGDKAQGWDFRITGLNLIDEYILSRAAWDGTFFVQNPEEVRLFYGQFGWTF